MTNQSPEVMLAKEIDNAKRCDACGCSLQPTTPVLFVQAGYGTVVCVACVRWAVPQLDSLEVCP